MSTCSNGMSTCSNGMSTCSLVELYHPFSIIGLTETKIKTNQDNTSVLNTIMPGYHFESLPTLLNAGGVGFYISNNYKYTVRDDLSKSSKEFESLWIEIHNDSQQNILCAVNYRHPNANPDIFINYIDSSIDKIQREGKLCVILGDFNLDLLKFETHPVTDNFMNILGTHFFLPHILQPTRITHHSETLIDNIFFNSIEHFTISGNLVYDLTDHLPNFIIVKKISSLPAKVKLYKRDYSSFDEIALVNDIQAIDWRQAFSGDTNPNDMFDSFYNKVAEIVDTHIPIKQMSKRQLKSHSKPWITPAIKISIQKKNDLYKKFLKTKSQYYHLKFKTYRNKINHLLKISKRKYYNDYFCKNTNNTKKTWSGIKQIISTKSQNNNIPKKIMKEDIEINNPDQIANTFNEYFANIGSGLADEIPEVDKSPSGYLTSRLSESFYIFPVSSFEIEEEIARLHCNKSSGPFSIPISILKSLKFVISKALEILFNLSFNSGIVPKSFKLAKVVPVFKSGARSNMSILLTLEVALLMKFLK